MAVGAKDYIDQLLVQKYATERVNNHEAAESKFSPNEVMAVMDSYSCVNRSFVSGSSGVNLQKLCGAVVAKAAYGNSAYRNTQKEREQLTAR